jgi:hypothetical protein
MMNILSVFVSDQCTIKEKISTAFLLLAFFGYGILINMLWGSPDAEEKAEELKRFECEERIVTTWAVRGTSDVMRVRERLEFIDQVAWGVGTQSHKSPLGNDTQLKEEAESLGVSEEELTTLDRQVSETCGPIPSYEPRWGGRVKVR